VGQMEKRFADLACAVKGKTTWRERIFSELKRNTHFVLLLLFFAGLNCAYAETEVRLTKDTQSVSLRAFVDVLEDVEGRLNIEAIVRPEMAANFHHVPGETDLNFGYSASTFWLRVRLTSEASASDHWLVEIAYPSLDQVILFSRSDNALLQQVAGDELAFSGKPFPHRNLVFPLKLTPGASQTIYLRVNSEGSLTLPLMLWSPSAMHSQDQATYSLLSLYFGMLLALGLYNLLLYISLRDRVYLSYVACVTSMVIAQSSMLGLGNQYLWPSWPTWGNVALPVGFCLTGFFGAMFTRQFLNTRNALPGFDKLIRFLQLAFVGAVLLTVFYAYRPGGIATALVGMAFSVTAVACGLLALKRGQAGAGLFLTAWTFLLVGVAMLAMRTLNWLPTNFLTSYGMQIGSAFEMLLFSFALAARIHILRQEKELAQAEALHAERVATAALKQSEKALEARIAQRTSELAETHRRSSQLASMLRMMCDNVPDMIWAKDLNKQYLFANQAMCSRLLNAVDTDEPVGKSDLFFAQREREAHPENRQWHTFGELCQDSDTITLERGEPSVFEESGNVKGSFVCLEVNKAPFFDANGQVIGTVGSARDITERKIEEEQVRAYAFNDPLTKLPNRRLFVDRLNNAIAACKRSGQHIAVLFLDLDNFKQLNDSHGHAFGDLLLIEVGQRLNNCVREMDTVSRFGGDEFAILIGNLSADESEARFLATSLAEKIRVRLGALYALTLVPESEVAERVEHRCTSSIGIVLSNGSGATSDSLLIVADTAMYQAKKAGRDSIHFAGC